MISFCIALFVINNIGYSSGVTEITLSPDVVQIINLPVNGSVTVNVSPETAGIAYALCQAHIQRGRITLSSKPRIQHSTAVTGLDVGVVTMSGNISGFTWYLFSNSTYNIRVLLHVMFFTNSDPLVGGCNQEFNLENDPNVALHVQSTKTAVQFQWSNIGSVATKYPSCEDTTLQSYLEYYTYFKYFEADDFSEDMFFNAVSQMLTAERVSQHATWLTEISNTNAGRSYLTVSSFRHRGVVYGIVVKLNNKKTGIHTWAAYIPVVSYGCDTEDISSCKERDIAGVVLSTLGAIVGIFLCFFGHRFFKTENFLFGFLIFGLIFYQVFALETQLSYLATLVLATVFGLLGGILLYGLWWYHGIPVINVLFIGLVTGYIITSLLYSTPLGNLSYLSTPFNYGATFACGVLLFPVILLYFTAFLNMLSCALVGSLAFVLALDMYLQSGLHSVILNSIRHGTDTSYIKVLVAVPFTDHEIALTVVWIVLLVAGVTFQLVRERRRAPFPPCPHHQSQRAKELRNFLPTRRSPDRQPLLRGDNYRTYGTSHQPHIETEETDSSEESCPPRMV